MEHKPIDLPGALAPAPAVMAILNRFNREEIGNAIEVLVGLLDLQDGDADVELNGDELDGTTAEDDYGSTSDGGGGPGCVISDPDCGVDDTGEADLAEDSFSIPDHFLRQASDGPGCSLADPGGCNGGEY